MNPTIQAEWDYRQGSNENPYGEGTLEWEEYEQHYDTLLLEEEGLTVASEIALAEHMGNLIDGAEVMNE